MSEIHDVIVIGSGPAGVSAAWPLVLAGRSVLMLDQGTDRARPADNDRPYSEIRRDDPEQWRRFLGEDFHGLRNVGDVSPKLKVPDSAYVFDGFAKAYDLTTDNFTAVGSLAKGGLSNAWGAGAYAYDDRDLADFPIARRDLADSYRTVAGRIGVSGVADDDMGAFYGDDLPLQDPVPLHDNAAYLFDRYRTRREAVNRDGVTLGRARNAVLTAPLGDRGACTQDDMCLWGCGRGAIYSAAQDLPGLMAHANFTYRNGAFVRRIARDGSGYAVRFGPAEGGAEDETARARIVVAAAGTLGSTKLVADFLSLHDRALPLMSNPAFAQALCLPGRLGASLPEKGFALGQLGFTVGADADYGHGALFAGSSLLITDIARYLPLTRPGAITVMRGLMPSLVFLNCFLSGAHSRHSIRLDRSGKLAITGAYSEQFAARAKDFGRRLSRAFRRLGAYALPGGVRVSKPGSDIHYAGTVPMTADGGAAGPTTDNWCALRGAENLFVVDGAVFPHLAAKNPTFTIMANADRVGRHILQRLVS